MPRKLIPQKCHCGCSGVTKGGWYLPGHDQKLRAAIEEKAGGLLELKTLVEKTLKCRIEMEPMHQS